MKPGDKVKLTVVGFGPEHKGQHRVILSSMPAMGEVEYCLTYRVYAPDLCPEDEAVWVTVIWATADKACVRLREAEHQSTILWLDRKWIQEN